MHRFGQLRVFHSLFLFSDLKHNITKLFRGTELSLGRLWDLGLASENPISFVLRSELKKLSFTSGIAIDSLQVLILAVRTRWFSQQLESYSYSNSCVFWRHGHCCSCPSIIFPVGNEKEMREYQLLMEAKLETLFLSCPEICCTLTCMVCKIRSIYLATEMGTFSGSLGSLSVTRQVFIF